MTTTCIIGSCVTRDIWRVVKRPLDGRYFARSSLASLMSPKLEVDEGDVQRLTSPFQRKSVVEDATREALVWIGSNKPDYIILDFVDERFDLVDVGGALLNNSFELHSSRLVQSKFSGARIIDRFSSECQNIWNNSLAKFLGFVQKYCPETKIIIHLARFQTHIRTSDGIRAWESEVKAPGRTAPIYRCNSLMRSYYDAARGAGILTSLEADERCQLSAEEHEWGPHPVHYISEYNLNCWDKLRKIAPGI